MPPAHRNNDNRVCGAKTTVQNQSTVFVNDQLWAVKDTICSHGDGQLIPTGTTVFVEDKLVIVHTADNAHPDDTDEPNPKTAEGSGDVFAY